MANPIWNDFPLDWHRCAKISTIKGCQEKTETERKQVIVPLNKEQGFNPLLKTFHPEITVS